MRIGFVGLGVMGKPMARNLLGGGHEVTVHNRSRGAVDFLAELGAVPAEDPGGVARASDLVFACLPGPDEVADVVFGEAGVLSGAHEGLTFVDTSTVTPELARDIANRASGVGVQALDAPVSGGEQGAIDGTLSVMVGGTKEAFEAARPALECVGKTVIHVGPAGSGQTVKAANQMLVAGTIELVSEALVLLENCDVDTRRAIEVLAGGLAGNRILDLKAEGMLEGRFDPGFRVDLHHKDLGIALEVARACNTPVPVTALVAQLLTALRATDRGQLDHSALFLVLDELAGNGIASAGRIERPGAEIA